MELQPLAALAVGGGRGWGGGGWVGVSAGGVGRVGEVCNGVRVWRSRVLWGRGGCQGMVSGSGAIN